MAKPEWGTKRTCQACGARFYDFARSPIACPACGAVLDLETAGRARRSRGSSRVAVAEEAEPVDDAEEEVEDDEVEADDAEDIVEDTGDDEGDEDRALIEDPSDLGDDEDMSEVIDSDIDDDENR